MSDSQRGDATRLSIGTQIPCLRMARYGSSPVTIASVRAHGVRQLLVYCLGKRDGDWPCHHQGKLPIDRFQAEEVLRDIERRCRCTVCGWGRADPRPDYNKQQAARQSVGWMTPPGQ